MNIPGSSSLSSSARFLFFLSSGTVHSNGKSIIRLHTPPVLSETINDLGVFHREQKHYEKAEKLLTEALEKRKIKLGVDHPRTLQSVHELAMLYKDKGDYDKAETLLLEAVEGRRLKLGDNHPHTQQSLNNLITLYEAWNKPEKAQEWRAKLSQTELIE